MNTATAGDTESGAAGTDSAIAGASTDGANTQGAPGTSGTESAMTATNDQGQTITGGAAPVTSGRPTDTPAPGAVSWEALR